ncbi:MAG: FlgO family outer membrane protein [Flavobacteriaceae bacterium]
MKTKMFFVAFVIIAVSAHSQSFDMKLEKLAKEIAERINSKEKTKVAIWGFFPESTMDKKNVLGNYLTEDFSIYLPNHAENFAVVDRTHLNAILKEHRLNAEGYVDERTAKRLGKIIAADAIVVGTYTIFSSEIRVRVRVLDTETALQFAGAIGNFSMNDNIARLLGKL